ncbi:MAG: hypothetical protein ABII23_00710 [bacterium]
MGLNIAELVIGVSVVFIIALKQGLIIFIPAAVLWFAVYYKRKSFREGYFVGRLYRKYILQGSYSYYSEDMPCWQDYLRAGETAEKLV